MKLDRNVNDDKRGKYALLKLRKLHAGNNPPSIAAALKTLDDAGLIDWGQADSHSEFFVMRLRDKHAKPALAAYAASAYRYDREYGIDVDELARRAGDNSKFCKLPD